MNTTQDIFTPREHEVLKWLVEGKTSWEISCLLGISEATVNFHFKNINAKLGTVNRQHTVATAIRQGLI